MITAALTPASELPVEILAPALFLGERLLAVAHWAMPVQRQDVESRVQELRQEWDRRFA